MTEFSQFLHENGDALRYFFLGMTTSSPFLAYKIIAKIFRKTDIGD